MKSEQAKRLSDISDENRPLKQFVADEALNIQMLKYLSEETGSPGCSKSRAETVRASVVSVQGITFSA